MPTLCIGLVKLYIESAKYGVRTEKFSFLLMSFDFVKYAPLSNKISSLLNPSLECPLADQNEKGDFHWGFDG